MITDTSGTIQYVNPAFTKITGYSAEEAVGQHTRFLKSDRQDPAYYQELWQTILAGEVWRGELINRRKDGTYYSEQMSITPVRDASGAITNFIAIKQDVTAHRATEAALRTASKNWRSVQQLALLGSWEMDVQTSEVRGSTAFFRIFDCPPGTVVQPLKELLNAIPAGDRERTDKMLLNTLQGNEPFDLEHGVVRGDGTIRVVHSRGQLTGEQGGEPLRLVGTSHDITGQRLAHQKLLQSEEKFRSLVANTPDVTWSSAGNGRTDYISPNIEALYGFTPAGDMRKGRRPLVRANSPGRFQTHCGSPSKTICGRPAVSMWNTAYSTRTGDGSGSMTGRTGLTKRTVCVMPTELLPTSPSASGWRRNCG